MAFDFEQHIRARIANVIAPLPPRNTDTNVERQQIEVLNCWVSLFAEQFSLLRELIRNRFRFLYVAGDSLRRPLPPSDQLSIHLPNLLVENGLDENWSEDINVMRRLVVWAQDILKYKGTPRGLMIILSCYGLSLSGLTRWDGTSTTWDEASQAWDSTTASQALETLLLGGSIALTRTSQEQVLDREVRYAISTWKPHDYSLTATLDGTNLGIINL